MGTILTIGDFPDPGTLREVEIFVRAGTYAAEGAEKWPLSAKFHKDPRAEEVREIVSQWNAPIEAAPVIETLNEASIVAFLDHTARLEGLTDSNAAIEKSRWKNLHYWQQSLWLPMENTAREPVVVDIGGMPTFIGTAGGLLKDLREIAQLSHLGFGPRPPKFDLMLGDPKAFYASEENELDEPAMLQWIWYA